MSVGSRPLRWRTPQFCLYYVVIVVALSFGTYRAWKFSSPSNPNFPHYKDRLSAGWLFGRMMDQSDAQWRSFRYALPGAIGMFLAYTLFHSILRLVERGRGRVSMSVRLRSRTFISVGGLFVLHGLNFLKILLLLTASFWIGKRYGGGKKNVALTWIYTCSVLFGLEYLKLSTFIRWAPLYWIDGMMNQFSGFFPRWYVTFNITILRLISFNLDYYNAHHGYASPLQHRDNCQECITSPDGSPCEKQRIQEAPELEAFSYCAFLTYTLYLPLYIAGPIITFNNFYSQLARPIKIPRLHTFVYGVRWVGSLLLAEVLLHCIYFVAIKDARTWRGFAPVDFFMLVYLNLEFIWLKLLVIWRFFHFWAMLDGILPQENMVRCMTNNYSGLAFWRSWHRSFNQWIVRYMYIPLGGNKTASWNIWPIFTFVAIWHDIRLHLLVWSWLICLFILPEVLLSWASRRLGWEQHPQYLRGLALAGGANMLMMGIANLVGFVVGIDGTIEMIHSISLGSFSLFLTCILGVLYCVASVLIEIRATERSQGIIKNY